MALIHPQSQDATKSELDVFLIPSTQSAIETNYELKLAPISTLSASSPEIEFVIPGNDDYVDMSSLKLHVIGHLVKNDGTNVTTDPYITAANVTTYNYAPAQYFLHTIFSSVEISLNGTRLTQAAPTYPYRAYLDVTLYTDKFAKDSHLYAAMYGERKNRCDRVSKSRSFDMYGALHGDICQQGKFLINHLPVSIKLSRSPDSFGLFRTTGAEAPKLVIDSCHMYVKKYKLSPTTDRAINLALESTPAKYFLTRTEVKTFQIPTGGPSFSEDHVFTGLLPRRFVVGIVPTSAFNGDYTQDPYGFKHIHINDICCYVDNTMIPSVAFKPDFTNDKYCREYYSLFVELNANTSHPSLSLSYSKFKDSTPLFAFNLSPDRSDGPECGIVNPQKRGNVRLEFKCSQNTTQPYTLIIYAHYDSVIQIDRDRQVQLSY